MVHWQTKRSEHRLPRRRHAGRTPLARSRGRPQQVPHARTHAHADTQTHTHKHFCNVRIYLSSTHAHYPPLPHPRRCTAIRGGATLLPPAGRPRLFFQQFFPATAQYKFHHNNITISYHIIIPITSHRAILRELYCYIIILWYTCSHHERILSTHNTYTSRSRCTPPRSSPCCIIASLIRATSLLPIIYRYESPT